MAKGVGNVRSSMRLKYGGARYSLRSRDVHSLPTDHLKRHKSSFPCKISKSEETSIKAFERRLLGNQDYKEQSLEFANAALFHMNYKGDLDFELVKAGLFEGAVISRGTIFHINFMARSKSDREDPVRTFFAQIRLIGDDEDDLTMFIDCCLNLGPTQDLPEEVYDGGCQYCSTLVYHPMGGCNKLLRGCVNDEVSWLERNTDAGYYRPSWYKYCKQRTHSSDTEVAIMTMEDMAKPQNFRSEGRYCPAHKMSNSKKNSLDDIEDRAFGRNEDFRIQSVEHATAALSHLNSKEGVDYELVKPGLVGGASISRGMIIHTNFKAKCKGDPDARVQTFFAQIRLITDKPGDSEEYVDCCVNLGPSDELPEKVYNGGCRYCDDSYVYHPIGGCEKLLLACENDDEKWLCDDHPSESPRLRPGQIGYNESLRNSGNSTPSQSGADVCDDGIQSSGQASLGISARCARRGL